ncbi:intradiol ring-cleavage dioxygenase [Actinoplanes sp. TBRC 11911]|nr:intradiol ring-cleavage dioxygenase [Actinoplanes sp. TBRC 11911]
MGRRTLFRAIGLGGATLGLAACSEDTTSSSPSPAATAASGEIPGETAGPYPGDGSNGPDVLEQSGIVRRDIRSSFGGATGTAEGVPMTLDLTINDLANGGRPFTGVAVYVWHCDRAGRYSLYSDGVTGENYLRGVQIADSTGRVTFTSVFPACYSGRWPHVHFEVYPDQAAITDSAKAIATSQLALPKEICEKVYAQSGYEASVSNLARVSLDSDNVFSDDEAAKQLAIVTGDVAGGYTVSLVVGVDTTTTPTGGQLSGGGPGQAPNGTPPSGGPGR